MPPMPASTRPRHKKPPVPREDVLDLVAPARLRCPAPVPPARCRPDPPIRRRRRHHSPACPDSGAIARRCSAPVPPRSRTQPASAHSRSRSADAYAPPPPTCLFVSCVNSSALVTSVPTASIACYAAFKTPFTGRLRRDDQSPQPVHGLRPLHPRRDRGVPIGRVEGEGDGAGAPSPQLPAGLRHAPFVRMTSA